MLDYDVRLLHRDIEVLRLEMKAQQEAFLTEVAQWRAEFEQVKKHVTTMQCEINSLRARG